jgi:hypothetical protein
MNHVKTVDMTKMVTRNIGSITAGFQNLTLNNDRKYLERRKSDPFPYNNDRYSTAVLSKPSVIIGGKFTSSNMQLLTPMDHRHLRIRPKSSNKKIVQLITRRPRTVTLSKRTITNLPLPIIIDERKSRSKSLSHPFDNKDQLQYDVTNNMEPDDFVIEPCTTCGNSDQPERLHSHKASGRSMNKNHVEDVQKIHSKEQQAGGIRRGLLDFSFLKLPSSGICSMSGMFINTHSVAIF